MSDAGIDSTGRHRTVAITATTLFSGVVEKVSAFDQRLIDTAVAWQELGGHASMYEQGSVWHRAEPGRAFTLFGRIAAAGEQLALAGAAYRDTRAWLTRDVHDDLVRLPARALAEVAGYYAISTAHGLVNIAARLLALESRSRTILMKEEPRSKGFPSFDEQHDHWLAFNDGSVTSLERAVDHHEDARLLVQLLRTLVDDDRWTKLVDRRHVDFHRWRPQSVHGGVATSNPWADHGDYQVLTVYDGETHRPEDHRLLIEEAAAALDALETAMRSWNDIFLDAWRSVTTYVLAEALGGVLLDRDRTGASD